MYFLTKTLSVALHYSDHTFLSYFYICIQIYNFNNDIKKRKTKEKEKEPELPLKIHNMDFFCSVFPVFNLSTEI